MAGKTFLKITNRDIFDKLEAIENRLSKMSGIVKWHTWAIGVLVLIIVGIISRVV